MGMLYSFDTEHRDFQIALRGLGISLQWGKAGITNSVGGFFYWLVKT